jgi:hypothetical protein
MNIYGRHSVLMQMTPVYKSIKQTLQQQNKLRGFSPPANYTDRATAACRRS